jgi:cystathionine beta-lyase
MEFNTLAIHGDRRRQDALGAVIPPVYLSTTYTQPGLGEFQNHVYTRGTNPTRLDLETYLAAIEDAKYAFAFASGMAATATVFNLFKTGDRILLNNNVYGGTFRYASQLFQNQGLSYGLVDDFNTLDFDSLGPEVKALFIETPSNPLLQVTDIRGVTEKAHKKGITVIVDNTFMTAYFQKPLKLGADLVVYSATKYYAGHSDILAGFIALDHDGFAEKLKLLQNTLGNVLSPGDSYMLQRSVKTLGLRLEQQEKNAQAMVDYLSHHNRVEKIYYPTMQEEQRRIQESQSTGNGAVLSLVLSSDCDPRRFIQGLSLFELAVSLGSVESLVCHPASMTHESFPPELREKAGISEGLIRLSIGIEDPQDLIGDLAAGLGAAKSR